MFSKHILLNPSVEENGSSEKYFGVLKNQYYPGMSLVCMCAIQVLKCNGMEVFMLFLSLNLSVPSVVCQINS